MATVVKFPPLEPDDLGTDVDVLDDFSSVWGLVSGRDNLGRAYYRRLNTPAGGLFYDGSYGYDVKDLLNADLTVADISSAKSAIKAQLMLDERTQSVDVVLTFNPTLGTLDIAINAETNDGPFALVLRATSVTLAVLVIDGVPVAPDITPDFIAADVAETPGAIVFPPSPPAVGALVGSATITLTAAATAKQPVADSYLFFSGYADNSGLSQTHANRGANSAAAFSQGIAYVPPACTVRALVVKPISNTRTVATSFTIYKNGAPTGIQVSVPAASTAATIISAAAVDLNGTTDTLSLVSSGSPTGAIAFGARLETGFVKVLKFAGIHTHDVAETCYLADVTGPAGANPNGYIPPAYTVAGLRVNVTSNKSTTRPVTVTVYKNGSPTGMTITIPSGTVGTFIDVTGGHAVALSGSDKLDVVTNRTGAGPFTDTQVFDSVPAVWTKPADAVTVEHVEYGAGGGGASGWNFGTVGSGGISTGAGGGGGAGGVNKGTVAASSLAATIAVVPGAPGAGAPAGTASSGTAGGSSTFGGVGALGGQGGSPPSAGVGGAGGAGGTGNAGTGGTGGQGATNFAGSPGGNGTGLAGGGGGGGGASGGSGNNPGGAGGSSSTGAGGAGGTGSAGAGAAGADESGTFDIERRAGGGGGGGAGAVVSTTPGGNGGPGGAYGAGGGGGGGPAGSASSGSGQSGARGAVIVQTTILAGDVAITATLELT